MLELMLCLMVPAGLIMAVLMFIIGRSSVGASDSTRPAAATPLQLLDGVELMVNTWLSQGRIPAETAPQIATLIQQDRARLGVPQHPPAAANPVPPAAAVPAPNVPAAHQVPEPVGVVRPQVTSPAAAKVEAPQREQIWDVLLARRTRQTLLLLGAFLVLISAIILVAFNWASFPPILQFALLAGVCGGLWGGGAWVAKQEGLERAGRGLQAVAGVLVPVVAFSLSRPGLLDLSPRAAWLLASALSLPIYVLASWRLRQVLFVVAGCISAASATMAALSFVEHQWLPPGLAICMVCYLPLVVWLRRRSLPDLAAGPYWLAHIGLPVTLLATLMLHGNDVVQDWSVAGTLWVGYAFYVLAAWLDRRARWSWAAAALAPVALLVGLDAAGIEQPWFGLVLGLAALIALGAGLSLETPALRHALPGYFSAIVLALLSLMVLDSASAMRWTLPPLLVAALLTTLAYHRGRLRWMGEPERLATATVGLVLVGGLIPIWTLALLELTALSAAQSGLLLLPLGALYFAASFWWPGRLRRSYDWALQLLGAVVAFGGAGITLPDGRLRVMGMVLLTLVFAFQTQLRRHSLWSAITLGSALVAGALRLLQLDVSLASQEDRWVWISVYGTYTLAYALGGTVLRRGAWRCWTWPSIGWAWLSGAATFLLIIVDIGLTGAVLPRHTVAIAALGALLALVAALWRQAWPGYLIAVLLALDVVLAASRGFFTPWQPDLADYGLILCSVTFGLILVGAGLRRLSKHYAYPYEVIGFILLTAAPIPAIAEPKAAGLTWASMALLYLWATWRYRLAWVLALALLSTDMAVLRGADWLVASESAARDAVLLLAASWAQALLGFWAYRHKQIAAGQPIDTAQSRVSSFFSGLDVALPSYVVAFLSGMGALTMARWDGQAVVLAGVALGLAALLALLGSLLRREGLAWFALALLALGLANLHRLLETGLLWSAAWGGAEALGLCLLGWALEYYTRQPGTDRQTSNSATSYVWRRPLVYGPLVAGLALCGWLAIVAPIHGSLPPLTFGLTALALLLTTLAVRLRNIAYGYYAGAVLVLVLYSQLYHWGFRQAQWYAIPAGIYLLALAEGLRRFQGQRGISQAIEAGGCMLMLGTTFGQSLRAEGLVSLGYAVALCAQSLALLGYGMLRQLRMPFFAGAGFFVMAVLWLSVDPLLTTSKWVLLGLLGLLLVGVYVLLERRQEQLVRTGRAIVERVSSWS